MSLSNGGLFMKCPECGFECLPGDVECLACGVHLNSAVENKEKERIRAIEANERKERYEIELKKELGLIPADDDKPEPAKGKTLEDTFKKKPMCPKCGAEKAPEAKECSRCGVIFDKLKYGVNGTNQDNQPSSIQSTATPIASRPPVLPPLDSDKTVEIDMATLELLLKQTDQKMDEEPEPPLEMESTSLVSVVPGLAQASSDSVPPIQNIETQRPSVRPRPKAETRVDTDRAGANGDQRFKFRSPQKSETTWTIYYKKFMKILNSVMVRVNSAWSSFETLSGGRKNALRNSGILVFVILLIASSPFIYSQYKDIRKGFQERAEQKRQKTVELAFFKRRAEINSRLRKIIDDGKFSTAEQEIAELDIPALKNEIRPLKNYLEEIRSAESVKKIPDDNYEKKYEAYSRLVKLNAQNEFYRAKMEEFRLKYADNEYMKALGYYRKGSKDPAMLDKAIKTVKTSVSLIPGDSKYQGLRVTLVKAKLLFYEGNDKIAMAVRDEGMGKRLFSDQRKISVWILNKSQEAVYINVQYFTMLGKNGIKYTYNDTGSKLSGRINPGEQTWGELYFRTSASPAKLTFNHLVCGKISREFP